MRRLRIAALGRLAGDRRGAALLLFTVFLVPLLAVVAVGIDVSRFLLVKQRLINAADAAALAVGTRPNLTTDEANAMAEAFIRAHYRDEGLSHLQSFSVTPSISQVGVTVHAQMETTFLKVLNVATLDVRVSSQVARAQRKLEVVLTLDNTGSMCQPSCAAKFDKLKVAANELVNILFGADTVSDTVKVGLVPFSGAVNVGIDKIGSGWLDEAGLSSLQPEDINLPVGQTLLGLVGQILNVGWGGCVRARTGPNGYDLTDEPPNLAVGETLFVPYFAPDEPGAGNGPSGGYTNNYVNDTLIPGDNVAKQRNALKYIGALISNANLARNPPQGPNYNCVPRPIQPLTNDKGVIAAAINAMAASGSTVIPEGLAWGWRALSPTPPYTEGAPYGDPNITKVLILLTDGRNQVEAANGHNHSFYSAYGYAASGHIGPADGSQTRQALDAKTATLCDNIKADKDGNSQTQDIYLYTISFAMAGEAEAQNLLRNCATPPSACPGNQCYYDVPAPEQLSGAFANIAMGINQLRLTR
jgi:Flp pilus assembly protein TadG